jgi:hypothetical protein
MPTFTIFPFPPVDYSVDGGTVTNYGPDVLYYQDERDVSSTVNDGSLAEGESATLAGSQWFVSAGRSTVNITAPPPTSGVNPEFFIAGVQYDSGWPNRPDAPMVIWNGGDVSTPPTVGGETGALDGVDWWIPATGEEA